MPRKNTFINMFCGKLPAKRFYGKNGITAGATREPIDLARYITNHQRVMAALCRSVRRRGAEVT